MDAGSLVHKSPFWRLRGRIMPNCRLIADALKRREANLITEASLQEKTSRDLAQMAKKKGVQGWHSMRKPQLVKALFKLAKDRDKQNKKRAAAKAETRPNSRIDRNQSPLISATTRPAEKPSANGKRTESAIARRLRRQRAEQEKLRNIAFREISNPGREAPKRDRIVLIVRDSFWLQGYWEITAATVARIKIAMGNYWHKAKPVLRLLEITSRGNTNSFEELAEEIPIRGGASNWFINVPDQNKSYRLAIGYVLPSETDAADRFYLITKSNEVLTMPSGSGEDQSWTDLTNNAEKYYAQSGGYDSGKVSAELKDVFEEKSQQPLHSVAIQNIPSLSRFGAELSFKVDAHLVIHGATDANASLTIAGSPVPVSNDGSFVLRMDLPDKRQVLPIIASSFDGTQQRTTVLAIERNTKTLEPLYRGVNEVET